MPGDVQGLERLYYSEEAVLNDFGKKDRKGSPPRRI